MQFHLFSLMEFWSSQVFIQILIIYRCQARSEKRRGGKTSDWGKKREAEAKERKKQWKVWWWLQVCGRNVMHLFCPTHSQAVQQQQVLLSCASLHSVPFLNSENTTSVQFQTRSLLMSHGTWEAVDYILSYQTSNIIRAASLRRQAVLWDLPSS